MQHIAHCVALHYYTIAMGLLSWMFLARWAAAKSALVESVQAFPTCVCITYIRLVPPWGIRNRLMSNEVDLIAFQPWLHQLHANDTNEIISWTFRKQKGSFITHILYKFMDIATMNALVNGYSAIQLKRKLSRTVSSFGGNQYSSSRSPCTHVPELTSTPLCNEQTCLSTGPGPQQYWNWENRGEQYHLLLSQLHSFPFELRSCRYDSPPIR